MSPIPKAVALVGIAGAALTDALLLLWATAQETSPTVTDLGAAGATGAAGSLAVLWFWKGIVDKRLDRIEQTKADSRTVDAIHETLHELRDDVRWLTRERRGE